MGLSKFNRAITIRYDSMASHVWLGSVHEVGSSPDFRIALATYAPPWTRLVRGYVDP